MEPSLILDKIRIAAGEASDSYLRVTLFESDPGNVRVMTALRAPVAPASAPVSLLPVNYQRRAAHIKHVGSFGQLYFGRVAKQQGFDDALLTTPEAEISETATANIAFVEADGTLPKPSTPSLHGITWQLLDGALAEAGIRTRSRPIMLKDLSGFAGALVTNSLGVVSVSTSGPATFNDDAPVQAIADVYESIGWDSI